MRGLLARHRIVKGRRLAPVAVNGRKRTGAAVNSVVNLLVDLGEILNAEVGVARCQGGRAGELREPGLSTP